jgi:hypothetical protein
VGSRVGDGQQPPALDRRAVCKVADGGAAAQLGVEAAEVQETTAPDHREAGSPRRRPERVVVGFERPGQAAQRAGCGPCGGGGERRAGGAAGCRGRGVVDDQRAARPLPREVGGQRGLQRGELPRRLARDDDLVEQVVHGAGAARRPDAIEFGGRQHDGWYCRNPAETNYAGCRTIRRIRTGARSKASSIAASSG